MGKILFLKKGNLGNCPMDNALNLFPEKKFLSRAHFLNPIDFGAVSLVMI